MPMWRDLPIKRSESMGSCKQCKYYMDCSIFAAALEESGVEITDFIANQICEAVLIGDKKED